MKTITKFYGLQVVILIITAILAVIIVPWFIKAAIFMIVLVVSCYFSYKLGRKYNEEHFNLKQFAEKQSENLNKELDELLKKKQQ
jgi:uncharacterized protein YacL